jgi:NitT/TauT family transport system ATP-binding protein
VNTLSVHTLEVEAARMSADEVLGVRELGMRYRSGGGQPNQVLADVTFGVCRGEFVCLVGPSGVGKTTLLRCLSGLQVPTDGTVLLDGVPISGPPERLSVVFQDYSRSLFPWMRVRDNVALPLRVNGVGKSERVGRASAVLAEVGLEGADGLFPWQLSGGMQQRVAIARALVSNPEILLMDEPFASVDAQTRFELEDLALRICRETGVSVLFVTHDIDEAVYLGNRVLVLSGSPAKVAHRIEVGLGAKRDQISTRSDPLFAELRTETLRHIRGS